MAGSLILVDEFTVSTPASSFIIGGGSAGSSSLNYSMDSTHNVYMLNYQNVFMSSDGAKARMRFTKTSDNSADSSANYDQSHKAIYTNQGFFTSGNVNQTYIESLALGTTNPESSLGTIYCFNFVNASEYSFITRELIQTTNTPETAGIMGGAVLTVAQATNGIQFFADTGNIASGTFSLYGLKK
tara:strand:+ start:933 stop:1487 length:555 start_codon:yes stop_codon:yes gene_type:complete